jgi:hypothetical protein
LEQLEFSARQAKRLLTCGVPSRHAGFDTLDRD